jgi:hypothetical protein
VGVPTNLIPTPITGLPEYQGSSTLGYLPYVLEGRSYKVQFANIAAVGAVPSSRVIAAGTGLAGGGDLSANRVISIANGGVGFDQLALSGVVAGTYGSGSAIPILTVDAKGRVTSATTAALDVTGFVPTSRTITAGDGLTGGGSLANNITLTANFSVVSPSALGVASPGTAVTLSRGDHVHPAVNLSDTTQTQGALPLGRGGTGDALSPVAGAVVYSTGSKFALTNPGIAGQVLVSAGTDEPQWRTVEGAGTVTSVNLTAGTGISVSGGPITVSGSINVVNTAPDQIVSLTGAGTTTISGTYPNFTITSNDSTVGTVTSVAASGGTTGLTFSGSPITSSGTLTLGGTLAVANGGTGASVAGTARTNLGAAASGANTDITSIALTTGTISASPVNGTDIVNKLYADSIASGINFHQSVRLATVAALPANTYNNGASGVGATLTANANGALSVDGVAVVAGNRILVKNEVAGANNGVYTVTQVGNGSTPYILTRATDFDSAGTGVDQIDAGDFFLVTAGSTQANTSWVQQTPLPITVGTTAIVFSQFAAPVLYSAGTGLTLAGTVFSITNTGVSASTYGSASSVPVLAINAQGQVTSASASSIAINASQITSGTVTVGQGGTGATTLGANGVLLGNGTSAISATAVGTTGQVLVGNTGAAPTWSTLSGIGVTSFSAGTTGLTPASATTGAITLAGTLGVANGGTGTATAFTAGSVVFAGASGVYSQDNAGLFWDNTNDRLGIGTASPATKLDVSGGDIRLASNATYVRSVTSGGTSVRMLGINAGNTAYVGAIDSGPTSTIFNASSTSASAEFYTSGSERMRITSAGDVGIGTASPLGKLQVEASNSRVIVGLSGSDNYYDANFHIFRGALSASAPERMRINSAGDVGIGTSSPDVFGRFYTRTLGLSSSGTTMIQINGTTYGGIDLGFNGTRTATILAETGGFYLYTNTAAAMSLGTNGLERMRITSAGNVGIGTSAPGSLLELSADLGPTLNLRRSGSADGNGVIRSIGNSGTVNSSIEFGGGLSNLMGFSTNGTERMRIDSAGLVGIGNLGQPIRGNLDISLGNITTAGVERSIHFGYSTVDFYGFKLVNVNSPGTTGAGTFSIQRGTTTAWSNVLLINDSGNVGINTTSPGGAYGRLTVAGGIRTLDDTSSKLELGRFSAGAPNSYIKLGTNSASLRFTNAADDTDLMTLTNAGNFGVGTNSPATKFVVSNGGAGGLEFDTNGLIQSFNRSTSAYQFMYFDAAQILFRPSGTERMRLDASGNLLVNTTSGNGRITVRGTGTTGSTYSFEAANSAGNTRFIIADNGDANFYKSDNGTAMRITDAGNVTIGNSAAPYTTSGRTVFNVNGTSSTIMSLQTAGSNRGYLYADGSLISLETESGVTLRLLTNAAQPITFFTNGTERMRISAGGDVGIGTSSANNRLQSTYPVPASVPSAGAGAHGLAVGSGGFGLAAGALNSGNAYLQATRWDGTAANYNLVLQPNGGDVGIGTTAPGYALDVRTNASNAIRVGSNSNSFGTLLSWDNPAGEARLSSIGAYALTFGTNTTERMRIDSSGNLLVGTTTSSNTTTLNKNGLRIPNNAAVTVGTSATQISVNAVSWCALAFVFGIDGGGNAFSDLVWYTDGQISVLVSKSISATPVARTYTAPSGQLNVAMASGSYSVYFQHIWVS